MKTKFVLSMVALLSLYSFKSEKNETKNVKVFVNKNNALKNWSARHGLTEKQYQDEVTKQYNKNFYISYVDAYYVNGKVRFAVLFKKGRNMNQKARHGLTAKEYQKEVEKNHKKGYRLTLVDGYFDGKQERYVALWKKASTKGLKARHGLTVSEYVKEFKKNKKDGYKLVHISGYRIKNIPLYAAIWEKGNPSNYVTRHKATSKEYQETVTKFWKQGYRVTQVDSYDVNKKVYYAFIMEKISGDFSARHNLNPKNYQLQVENHYYQGYVPMAISGHDAGKDAGYTAVFKNVGGWKPNDAQKIDLKIQKIVKDYKIPGVAIGIVKNEKLVYAKGYGYGNKEQKIIVSPLSLFRLASISKPITAVGILKLVENGKLKLTDKVFGNGNVFGKTYGNKPYSNREKAITIQHLLEHTAGGHAWDHNTKPENVDNWGAPMFQEKQKSQSQLISWVLDKRNPTHKPGSFWEYSNFGYCVLGRIIEKKTGKSYESYLKHAVLSKCGITEMQIGPEKKSKKKYKEVVYYSGGNPYTLQMRRMDSHGGWIASAVDLMRFIVRVDGEGKKKDILKKSTVKLMTTKSTANSNYAKGWGISGNNWSHGGGMSGTSTFLKKKSNGISYVILTNFSKKYEEGETNHRDALKKALEDAFKEIQFWPNIDLF